MTKTHVYDAPSPHAFLCLRVLDPQRLNLYAYSRNNPLVFLDPNGKDMVSGTGNQSSPGGDCESSRRE